MFHREGTVFHSIQSYLILKRSVLPQKSFSFNIPGGRRTFWSRSRGCHQRSECKLECKLEGSLQVGRGVRYGTGQEETEYVPHRRMRTAPTGVNHYQRRSNNRKKKGKKKRSRLAMEHPRSGGGKKETG